eukprot:13660634-Alexandrium_andersonii.AAC.1
MVMVLMAWRIEDGRISSQRVAHWCAHGDFPGEGSAPPPLAGLFSSLQLCSTRTAAPKTTGEALQGGRGLGGRAPRL